MARNSQEGHQPQFPCNNCDGKGVVVQPVVVIDPDTGAVSTREEAGTCWLCGGEGWV